MQTCVSYIEIRESESRRHEGRLRTTQYIQYRKWDTVSEELCQQNVYPCRKLLSSACDPNSVVLSQIKTGALKDWDWRKNHETPLLKVYSYKSVFNSHSLNVTTRNYPVQTLKVFIRHLIFVQISMTMMPCPTQPKWFQLEMSTTKAVGFSYLQIQLLSFTFNRTLQW